MQSRNSLDTALQQHRELLDTLPDLAHQIEAVAQYMALSIQLGAKIMFCGNGGSAGDAQHLAAEFVGRFTKERRPLPAISLCVDPSVITCVGNDYGYDQIFSRQVEALAQHGDSLVCISTSGGSRNVLRAANAAAGKGITVLALTGAGPSPLLSMATQAIEVRSNNTARVQEMHILIGHVLVARVEQLIGVGAMT